MSSSFFLEKGKSRLANLCHASSTQAIWMSDCSIKMRAFFLGPLASGPDWIPTTSRKTAQWDDFGWSDLYNDYELWFMKIPNWQRKCGTVEYRWFQGPALPALSQSCISFQKVLDVRQTCGHSAAPGKERRKAHIRMRKKVPSTFRQDISIVWIHCSFCSRYCTLYA